MSPLHLEEKVEEKYWPPLRVLKDTRKVASTKANMTLWERVTHNILLPDAFIFFFLSEINQGRMATSQLKY